MGDFTKLAKKVVSVARGEDKKKPSPYDTKATVNRVDYENRKAYVRFYGGVDETPVDLTVNCERGDTVQVRVGGGRAWIVGNQTAPPTDDKAVNILKHTVNNLQGNLDKTREDLEKEIEEIEPGEGKLIERIATEYILSELNYLVDDEVVPYEPTPGEPMEWSEELPEWVPNPRTYYWTRIVIYYTDGTVVEQDPILDANAQISAEADFAISSENNHFWHDTTGAYVTEQNKNAALGYASRVTNAGILQTYNGNLLTAWTGSGVSFYDGSGATASASKMLASFNSTGITFDTTTPFTIGNTTGQNPSYIRWINDNGVWKLQINADTIQFGGNDVVTSDEINLYSIETSVESIIQTTNNTVIPSSLDIYFYESGEPFTGRIRIRKSINGTSWVNHDAGYGDDTYTITLSTSSFKYYKIEMYEDSDSSYTNLLTSKTIPVIANGEEGTGIDSTTITYATSSSYSTPPSSGWQSTPPYVSQGYYLWTKTIFSYSDGTSSDPVYSVARQGVNGQDGTDGEGFLYNQYIEYSSSGDYAGLRFYAGDKTSSTYSSTFSVMKNDGLHIYVDPYGEVGSFTENGAQIGAISSNYNIKIDQSGIWFKRLGTWFGQISGNNGLNLIPASSSSVVVMGPFQCTGTSHFNSSSIMDYNLTVKGDIIANDHSSRIGAGETGTNNSSLSLPTATAKWISKIGLTAGNWIVIGECRFPSTSTSNKAGRLNIASTSGSDNIDEQRVLGNIANHISLVKFVNPTSTTTYYLNAWQNTGSTVTVSAVSLYARRLA